MEIRQLETFVAVAKNLNFSKAAEEVHMSQPTISIHIKALEDCLNTQLLVRSTKEVALSKAGKSFLVFAKKILAVRDQALADANGEDANAAGSIDILSSTIPAQYLLPEIIASFLKRRPNVIFRVAQADSRQVQREMGDFRYDFGLVGTAPDSDCFVHYPLCSDELVMILPNDAPPLPASLSGADGSGRQTMRNAFSEYVRRVPFVMRESGSGTRAEIEKIFSKTDVDMRDLHVAAYFPDTQSILLAVSKGMGVSLVSKVAATMYVDAGLLKAVEMNDPLFHRHIHLLYNKQLWLSPMQQIFCDHARQFYGNNVFL